MKSYKIPLSYNTLNDDQKTAFDMLKFGLDAGQNFFLMGDAGVGKSYLIGVYSEFCSMNGVAMLKAAPTGTAAVNVKGSTLHKLFRLPFSIIPAEISSKQLDNIYSMIAMADVIFIDEISMVRVDMFENVMLQIRKANEIRANKRIQPIQVIISGDFGQLKPIVTAEDRRLYQETTGKDIGAGCCYDARMWDVMDFNPIALHKQMRQSDPAFCNILDMMRIGVGTDKDIAYLNDNSAQAEIPGGIWLCGYKDTAAEKNAVGLYRLPGELRSSKAVIRGKAKIEQTNLAENLLYKVGARVMMTRNQGNEYHNGSLGTIRSETPDGHIVIALDSGRVIMTEKCKTSFYEYKVGWNGHIEQVEVGSIQQYPFKIGYAVTIHKSQGATYDSMNLVPEIFAVGQLYTAISRCRSLGAMYIQPDKAGRRITKEKLMPDKDIVKFLIDQDGKAFEYKAYFESQVSI